MKRVIKAGVFKAECLKIMDEVKNKKHEFIITKHNEPVAKLVPIEKSEKSLFGRLKGTVAVNDDLTLPIDEVWDADL